MDLSLTIRTDPAVPVARVAPAPVPAQAQDPAPAVPAAADMLPVDLVVRAVKGLVVRVGKDLVDLVLRAVKGLADRVGKVPADPVVRAVKGLVVRVVRDRVVPVIPVDLMAPVVRVDLRGPGDRVDRVDLVVLAVRNPVDRVDLTVGRVARAGLKDRGDPVDLVITTPVDLEARADLADLADLVDLVDRTVPVARAVPADRHHLRMSSTVSTTTVARSGVAPTTRHMASARRTMARHLRRHHADSAGTVDLPPERRRPTGTDPRLPEAGTDRPLPEAGTRDGTGRHAISATHSATSDRSRTTATTPHRCSTRCSADGASGSSESGFRCTDIDPTD